jgi:hypothetical protein
MTTPSVRTAEEFATIERQRIIDELRAAVDARIRPVVRHLPESEIVVLIERIVAFKYRHEGAGAVRSTPPRARAVQTTRGTMEGPE